MDPSTLTRAAGLVGGLCWLVRLVLAGGVFAGILYWLGLVLLAGALVALGASLVSRSVPWLRAVVGVAFPLLVWSVLAVFHPAASGEAVDGVFGLLAAAVCGYLLMTSRPAPRQRPAPGARVARRSAGAHSR
jgi:hypothetical protein